MMEKFNVNTCKYKYYQMWFAKKGSSEKSQHLSIMIRSNRYELMEN
jgi:hypothetical protein